MMKIIGKVTKMMNAIPYSLVALLGRFALASIFWLSGQTKIEGFKMNFFSGEFHLGWPYLSPTATYLFETDYKLPFLSPEVAIILAASAEFILPILLLVGLGTRFTALGLLIMTLVIQIFVYPSAYVLHITWITIALMLIAQGPGVLSLDYLLAKKSQD